MKNKITKQNLLNFEKDIYNLYSEGKIKGVIHLSGGNEKELLDIFKEVKENDWVFSTHRNHYHSLLKSQNSNWVKEQIMKGRSMHISSNKYKIFTSSIVGGIIPIALGVALSIKKRNQNSHVWCFIGDMASQMGCFHEALKYAEGYNLPLMFVIEDNNYGVYTPTWKTWEVTRPTIWEVKKREHLIYYQYERIYPHHGTGKWVHF